MWSSVRGRVPPVCPAQDRRLNEGSAAPPPPFARLCRRRRRGGEEGGEEGHGREGGRGGEGGRRRRTRGHARALARSPKKNPREALRDAGSLSRAEAASSSADSLIKSNAAARGSDGAFKRRIVLPVRRVWDFISADMNTLNKHDTSGPAETISSVTDFINNALNNSPNPVIMVVPHKKKKQHSVCSIEYWTCGGSIISNDHFHQPADRAWRISVFRGVRTRKRAVSLLKCNCLLCLLTGEAQKEKQNASHKFLFAILKLLPHPRD